MRRYGLYDATRGFTTVVAVGLAGLAFWGAAQVGTQTASRFWIAMVIVAAAGFLLAFSQHVGSWTKGLRLRLSPGTFVLGFLPVLVVVGWILLASQPAGGWQHGRIEAWSGTIGILGAVHGIGLWRGVFAFGFGLVLGFCLDAVPAPDLVAYERPAAAELQPVTDEPLTAERWSADGQSLRGGIRSERAPGR